MEEQQGICTNHIYGHSEIWDRLIYGKEDEIKCIADTTQPENQDYRYSRFFFCPMCGGKINREEHHV